MAGLYLHIPYCKQACSYCDFYFSTNRNSQPTLLDALTKEIALEKHFFEGATPLKTIYLGGGSPSLLTQPQLEALFVTIHRTWSVTPEAEITLEANPDDVQPATAAMWQAVGINRISLGVQSFNDDVLAWMRRAHNANEARRAIQTLQNAGFTNLSLDLIYHVPEMPHKLWQATLREALAYQPQHLSCYSLTLEPNTLLGRQAAKGQLIPPPDADFLAQYQHLLEAASAASLSQYEISSFAAPGYHSRHNSSYWAGNPYLGIGPAAHSFDGKHSRRWNALNLHSYTDALAVGTHPPRETETLTDEQRLLEILFTRLRTTEGLYYTSIPGTLRNSWLSQTATLRAGFVTEGIAQETSENFRLTPLGLARADGVAAALLP